MELLNVRVLLAVNVIERHQETEYGHDRTAVEDNAAATVNLRQRSLFSLLC